MEGGRGGNEQTKKENQSKNDEESPKGHVDDSTIDNTLSVVEQNSFIYVEE